MYSWLKPRTIILAIVGLTLGILDGEFVGIYGYRGTGLAVITGIVGALYMVLLATLVSGYKRRDAIVGMMAGLCFGMTTSFVAAKDEQLLYHFGNAAHWGLFGSMVGASIRGNLRGATTGAAILGVLGLSICLVIPRVSFGDIQISNRVVGVVVGTGFSALVGSILGTLLLGKKN